MKYRIADLDEMGIAVIRSVINAVAMDVESIEADNGMQALHKLMHFHPDAYRKIEQLQGMINKLEKGA